MFSKICGYICKSRCTPVINDNSGKFAINTTSVVDTGGNFATCVNDTGSKFTANGNDTGGKLWEQTDQTVDS